MKKDLMSVSTGAYFSDNLKVYFPPGTNSCSFLHLERKRVRMYSRKSRLFFNPTSHIRSISFPKNSILNNVPHTGHNRIKNVKSMGEANPHVYGILSGMEENYQRCLSLSKKTCRARTIRDAEKKLFGTSRELDEIFSQLKDE